MHKKLLLAAVAALMTAPLVLLAQTQTKSKDTKEAKAPPPSVGIMLEKGG